MVPDPRFPLGSVRIRVLVVDDEEMSTATVERMLRPHADVTVAGSAAEALAHVAASSFDAIVCDVGMPDGGGEGLYRAIQAEDEALAARMLFMTGGAVTRTQAAFLDEIADRGVGKPFRSDELLSRLSILLKR